jgi:hypothetical protein
MPICTFVLIRYIISGFGILYQEKSGNPGLPTSKFGFATVDAKIKLKKEM